MKQLIAALTLACAPVPLWSQTARLETGPTASAPSSHDTRSPSTVDFDQAAAELEEITLIHSRLMEATERMTTIYSSLQDHLGAVCGTDGEWSTQPGDDKPLDNLCRSSVHDTLEYLELQHRMQRESRRFQTLSNALKARHDTAKSTIQNTR